MAAVDVSYRIEGQGPALYLVHGIGARKSTWNQLIDGLKQDFTCVSYDLRGHGESPMPKPPYSLEDLVDDLEALRRRLGHQKIHVVGHSLGGMIGPAYAHSYPEHILSVGLLSTAAGRSDGYLYNIIRNGGGRMPNYRRIPDEDRWHLVNYVRYLQQGGKP